MPTEATEPVEHGLYDVAQLRAIERQALSGVPAGTLMQRAGAATAALASRLTGEASSSMLVLAGPGNNGGDALDAAARLCERGHRVSVVLLADATRLPADAAAALQRARNSNVSFIPLADTDGDWALAIDGLFGIGLVRAPEGEFLAAIDRLNALGCPILAIDVPSGLDADTGNRIGQGPAVRADHTLTFIGDKPGLHTAEGRDHAGQVHVDALGIAESLFDEPRAMLCTPALFAHSLNARLHASHKGSYGDLTVIGGASGMGGAVLLAARMGAMAGAGRVFAAFAGSVPAFDPVHPELMCRAAHAVDLANGAVVAGPGLGMSREAVDLVARALGSALPLVIDADALNLIATEPGLQHRLVQRHAPSLLTPHPLEAARLLGIDAAAVQADRLAMARQLACRLRAHVILKGSGSVIASPAGELAINASGSPALATAGSGDVLAGLCGALLAQHLPMREAALAATWMHGHAADQLVAGGLGPVGLTASELPAAIRRVLNALSAGNGQPAGR